MIPPFALAALPLALAIGSPQLAPTRTSHAPKVDGRLDDPGWTEALPSSSFVQKFPDEGRPPSETTTVRVLYDDDAVYLGIECEQRGVPVVARLTRRDRTVDADRVEIDLGTRGDGKSAFHFGVNAAGVLVDGIRYDDTELDLNWDESWEAEARTTADGWTVEVRIPLAVLRFPTLASQSWGFQVRRYLSARQEIDEWAFIPRSAAGEVSHYGVLGPFVELKPGSPFELRPFVLARLRRLDPTAETLASGTHFSAAAGVDAKWHIARDLTLDATVFPDFAQVEADQVVLNLTTYETFFPEKRPFFLEGLDAFAVPVQLLYTRRIGRQPSPTLRDGETLVDAPEPSIIYGAAKLTGQLGSRFTMGALAAVTGSNEVTVQASDGNRSGRPADPLASFAVLRLKRDLGDNAHLGVMAIAVNRSERVGDYPDAGSSDPSSFCPGGEIVPRGARCFHDVYIGAVDGRWRSPSGDYLLSGMALASLIENGPPRLALDGTVLSSGDFAPGVYLRAAKEGGSWLFDVTYEGYAPKLELNDLGYLLRANLHSISAIGEYKDRTPRGIFLESSYRLELFHRRNSDWLNLAELYQINTSGKLENFWEYFIELHYRGAHFDDREVGDGTALERAGLVGLEVSLNTDPRRAVVAGLSAQNQRLFDGWNFIVDASVGLKLLPQLEIELLPQLTYTSGEPRFVDASNSDGRPIFGHQEATSVGATLRATYTFTPNLTLQTYAQVFLASVHYSDFVAAERPMRTVRLDDLRPTAAPPENPDIQEGVVNANIVLRWEWRLGSTLFLVYTRSQSPATALEPGERPRLDLGSALRGPAADVLLLKISLWWA